MKIIFSLMLLACFASGGQGLGAQTKLEIKPTLTKPPVDSKYNCLPSNVTAETVVDARRIESAPGVRIIKESVAQRLDKIKARCKGGKLVDGKGREVRFYELQNCWGNPPADYQEIEERQENELKQLKKKFTVIEITCNPSGVMPY